MTKPHEASIEVAAQVVDRAFAAPGAVRVEKLVAEIITAYLAGDVVVPREATYEMGEAGIASLGEDDDRQPSLLVRDIYRAMVSAATEMEQTSSQKDGSQ